MEKNIIHQGDAESVLKESIPDCSIDLVLTSPPYDELRDYDNHIIWDFDKFKLIAHELERVLKKGGVIVWITSDMVKGGSETGSSLYQALYFKDECGLRLHDTMLYEKNSSSFPARKDGNRYTQLYEYMFVFSKGKPKTANLLCDKENRWVGWKGFGQTSMRNKDGTLDTYEKKNGTPRYSPRGNIWKPFNIYEEIYHKFYNRMVETYGKKIITPIAEEVKKEVDSYFSEIPSNMKKYNTGKTYSTSDKIAFEHPAIFPEKLAEDHIRTWSNEGDIVLDPFAGSGTTLKKTKELDRSYIGIEVNPSYIDIINKRLKSTMREWF